MVIMSPSPTTRWLPGRSFLAKLVSSCESASFLPMSFVIQESVDEPEPLPSCELMPGTTRGIVGSRWIGVSWFLGVGLGLFRWCDVTAVLGCFQWVEWQETRVLHEDERDYMYLCMESSDAWRW